MLAPGAARSPTARSGAWSTATGTYDVEDTVVVRYRTRDGASGVDVVVPLVTADGTALLVDRGWLATQNRGADRPTTSPRRPRARSRSPAGCAPTRPATAPRSTDQSTRAISSERDRRGARTARSYGGFVEPALRGPRARRRRCEPVELPELDNGPHFFYGLQWWFFGVLAIFGFCYLA